MSHSPITALGLLAPSNQQSMDRAPSLDSRINLAFQATLSSADEVSIDDCLDDVPFALLQNARRELVASILMSKPHEIPPER
jgi:hypothetical protein